MQRYNLKIHHSEILGDLARNEGFDIHCDQLDTGYLQGIIDFLGTVNAQFFRDHFDREICNHGSIPKNMIAFTFPTTPLESAVFLGGKVTPTTLCAITPGDGYSYRAPANHGIFGVCFSALRLDSFMRSRCLISLPEVLSQTKSLQIPLETMNELRLIMQSAFVPPQHPDLVLDHDAWEEAIEERLMEGLCRALTACMSHGRTTLAARNHWRCVRKAFDFIEAHLGHRLRMETLCHFVGVSERTLDAAFLEVTGLTPRNFIKIRRLNAVRHALRCSRSSKTSVKEIALKCGFWHMGNFSHDYHAFFKVIPSADFLRF